MANWTNINDVMRDLSVAQGRNVPASLEIYGNAPPNLNIDEEHYLKSHGDENFTTKAPDFTFIQEMISMVSNNKDKNTLKNLTISSSNLNPLTPEFVPRRKREMELPRNKICRNVALKSILDILETKTLEKEPNISKSPSSMFRKKRVANIDKKILMSSIKSDGVISKCEYTPSILANEYYNKYMEKTKLRDQNKEDITEPVREIYVRRNPASERKFQRLDNDSSSNSNDESTELGLEFILQRHRHLSLEKIEDCIVCNITEKHGYSFNEENIDIGPWGDGFKIKHITTPSLPNDNVKEDNNKTN